LTVDGDNFVQSLPWPDFRQLYSYWRSKAAHGMLPGRADISPFEMRTLLPRIFLLDVLRQPIGPTLGFRFRLAGTEHYDINGREITGREIGEIFEPEHVKQLRSTCVAVVTSARPTVERAHIALPGRGHIRFYRLLLPLAQDGRTVDMLLGYLRPIRRTAH
jgi:hypothetical protein